MREDRERAPLREGIRAAFESHGIAADDVAGTSYLAAGGLAVGVEVFNEDRTASGWSCQIDVRVVLPDARILIESFSGLGADRAAMFRDALESFVRSSFHVLLCALITATPDDQVDVEEWIVGGTRYRAFIGDVVSRGRPPGGRPPTDWFPDFERAIGALDLDGDLHWIRLYYAQMNHETMAVEVLLDNEPWNSVQSQMAAFPWPRAAEFYSARIFMMLRRADHGELLPAASAHPLKM